MVIEGLIAPLEAELHQKLVILAETERNVLDDGVIRPVILVGRRIDEDRLGLEFEFPRLPHLANKIGCCGCI